MKKIIKLLQKNARDQRIPQELALDSFLDFLIMLFDCESYLGNWKMHVKSMYESNPLLMDASIEWCNETAKGIREHGWRDCLGELYEMMYQSKGKASALGQFFTPACICDLMAESITVDCRKKVIIEDCACGSGRTLLAEYSRLKRGYYIGGDVDLISVKMCSLNMAIHGARGRVLYRDALLASPYFDRGYEINEIREPFPSPLCSVRMIRNPTPEKIDGCVAMADAYGAYMSADQDSFKDIGVAFVNI